LMAKTVTTRRDDALTTCQVATTKKLVCPFLVQVD